MILYNPKDIYRCLVKKEYPRISEEETCNKFGDLFESGEPFLAGRMGATESYVLRMYEYKYKSKYDAAVNQLCEWSGFFPNDKSLMPRFVDLYKSSMNMVDFLYPMGAKGNSALIDKYCRRDIDFLRSMAVWKHNPPWSSRLAGKKVLVIHPFKDSIEAQYSRRELIYPGKDTLPEFDLTVIRAVQTIAGQSDGRFKDWFEALDYMCEEIKKVDFDIALIGCGAYGLPLGAFVKDMGKQAIHMGGDLQMLFGIKGARWEERDDAKGIINDAWVKPLPSETPERFTKVEGGCYW